MNDTIWDRLRRLGAVIEFPGAQFAFDAADEGERLEQELTELKNQVIVTVGGIDVNLIAVIGKKVRTIEALEAKVKRLSLQRSGLRRAISKYVCGGDLWSPSFRRVLRWFDRG